MSTCCAPDRGHSGAEPVIDRGLAVPIAAGNGHDGMVRLEGEFLMGTRDRDRVKPDGESPVRRVSLSPFYIDAAVVTNAQFATFVEETSYVTEAEGFGWSFVFHDFVSRQVTKAVTQKVAAAPWWWRVDDAWWRNPEGPDSTIEERMDHPVVHVSWSDALAYCQWSGKRLPTEAEWEYAARGGLSQKRFPWGDELTPGGDHRCNVWQGVFPKYNSRVDGHAGTAPARSFEPNAYGLYNTSGNLWEWCSDRFSPNAHRRGAHVDPKGPTTGDSRVTKGGSYLCHASYCNRYRVAARTSSTPDSSTGHIGFRCAEDAT